MITVLFGGSRPEGNTAQLTQYALENVEHQWIDVTQYQLNPVRDVRHNDKKIDSYPDDYEQLIKTVLESDVVIFASPIYWYSLSASLKAFIDHWSETMVDERYSDFKEIMSKKDFRLILVGGDCPKVKSKPCVDQMKYTLEFIGGELAGYIIGTAERPGDIMKDNYALERARRMESFIQTIELM